MMPGLARTGLPPQEVLREQDFIFIRVRGVLTTAATELIKQPQEAELPTDGYRSMREVLLLPKEA
jgi:hypothetical protein